MHQRLWEHLLGTHGMHPDRPETWTVHMPAQFQKLTGTGAFDAMPPLYYLGAVIDDLLGPSRWQRPAHWGRPLVTFPDPGTAWDVPTSDWHLDSQDLELTMLAVFAHLSTRAAPRWRHAGGHRLTPADHTIRTAGRQRPGSLGRGEGAPGHGAPLATRPVEGRRR